MTARAPYRPLIAGFTGPSCGDPYTAAHGRLPRVRDPQPEIARFCMACAGPMAPAAPARETRKVVTVVFADVTGSTGLGERLDPESLRAVMGRWFETLRDKGYVDGVRRADARLAALSAGEPA